MLRIERLSNARKKNLDLVVDVCGRIFLGRGLSSVFSNLFAIRGGGGGQLIGGED